LRQIRILILYQFDSNKHLINRLVDELKVFEIKIDLFNTRTFSYTGQRSFKIKLLQLYIRIPKLRVFVYKLFRKKIILELSQQYDLIDIHFFSSIYDEIIPSLSKPKKVVFWGSDIYRIKPERLCKFNELLSGVNAIHFLTPEMKEFVLKNSFQHRQEFTQPFGVVHFDKIRTLKAQFKQAEIKSILGLNLDKIQVTIGYNASPSQQHIEIIKEITQVTENIKSRIELVFLLTYGGNSLYINQIENELKKSGYDFKIIDKQLNEEEICSYRIASDITLNFQTSDGFSASIQEHFFAGNVMILAEWLPYEWLRDKGLYFIRSSFQELSNNLETMIVELEKQKTNSSINMHLIEQISDWKFVANNWVEIYKKTIES
jgi:hypothetical protein